MLGIFTSDATRVTTTSDKKAPEHQPGLFAFYRLLESNQGVSTHKGKQLQILLVCVHERPFCQ